MLFVEVISWFSISDIFRIAASSDWLLARLNRSGKEKVVSAKVTCAISRSYSQMWKKFLLSGGVR